MILLPTNPGSSLPPVAQTPCASRTTNGYLREPSTVPLNVDIQPVINENRILLEDNRRLTLIIKDAHEKQEHIQKFYNQKVQALEQQVVTLQRENQVILAREKNLAVGHTEYAQLQQECLRLQNDCVRLRNHIIGLQSHTLSSSNSILVQPSLHRTLPSGQSVHHSIQVPSWQQQELASGQHIPPPDFNQNHPSISMSKSLMQRQQGNQRDGSSPDQKMRHHKPACKYMLPKYKGTRSNRIQSLSIIGMQLSYVMRCLSHDVNLEISINSIKKTITRCNRGVHMVSTLLRDCRFYFHR